MRGDLASADYLRGSSEAGDIRNVLPEDGLLEPEPEVRLNFIFASTRPPRYLSRILVSSRRLAIDAGEQFLLEIVARLRTGPIAEIDRGLGLVAFVRFWCFT